MSPVGFSKKYNDPKAVKTYNIISERNGVSKKMIDEILGAYPEINRTWLLTGEGEMLKNTTDKPESNVDVSAAIPIEVIPLLPISAQGGTLNDFVVAVKGSDCERIISPIKGADFAITVSGDSMAPEYPSGSQIIIKKINEQAIYRLGQGLRVGYLQWSSDKTTDACRRRRRIESQMRFDQSGIPAVRSQFAGRLRRLPRHALYVNEITFINSNLNSYRMAGYNTFKMYTFILRDQHNSRNIPFSEFYQKFTNLQRYSSADVFQEIARRYLFSFRQQFMTNQSGDRGISVVDPRLLLSNQAEQIIHGFVQGGPSDDQYAIYERDQTPIGTIEPTQILSQDYYFLIYFPRDAHIGCVILQHNSSIIRGISSAFFEQLNNFFFSYQLKFQYNLYIPRVIQQNYLSQSTVSKINVIETKRTNEFEPREGNVQTIKVKHTVNGIKIPFLTCIGEYLHNGRLPASTAHILGVEMDQNEGLEVSVECKVGKETKTYSLRREQIRVNLSIDNRYIDTIKTRESVEKMYECAQSYLSLFKEEILR